MKKFVFLLVFLCAFTLAFADTNENLAKLQQTHKNCMQNFGHLNLRTGKFSYAVSGKDLVSVCTVANQVSFYTETRGKKIYSNLTIKAERDNQVAFQFDNKIIMGENTYSFKYKIVCTFGNEFGYIIVTDNNTRWDLWKCGECLICAGKNIYKLYQAYKECGLDFGCWQNHFPTLMDLYTCVKDKCIACFTG